MSEQAPIRFLELLQTNLAYDEELRVAFARELASGRYIFGK